VERPRQTTGRRRQAAPMMLEAPAHQFRRRRAATDRRNRVLEPRQLVRPHAPVLADRGAQQGTAARSAGWLELSETTVSNCNGPGAAANCRTAVTAVDLVDEHPQVARKSEDFAGHGDADLRSPSQNPSSSAGRRRLAVSRRRTAVRRLGPRWTPQDPSPRRSPAT
jgi:hypothetical protein